MGKAGGVTSRIGSTDLRLAQLSHVGLRPSYRILVVVQKSQDLRNFLPPAAFLAAWAFRCVAPSPLDRLLPNPFPSDPTELLSLPLLYSVAIILGGATMAAATGAEISVGRTLPPLPAQATTRLGQGTILIFRALGL